MRPRQAKMIGGVPHYECSACDEWLPVSAYYGQHDPRSRCGLRSACKVCEKYRRLNQAPGGRLSDLAAMRNKTKG